MNSKTLSFGLFAILSVFLIAGIAGALSFAAPSALNDAHKSTIVELTNTAPVTQNVALSISDVSGIDFSVSPSSITGFENSTKQNVNVSVVSIPADLKFGVYTATLNATGTNTSTNIPVSFVEGFCESGSVGRNLSISQVDISSSGDEDEEWMPLDEITIDVDVESIGNVDVKEVMVELGLFNSNGKNVAKDLIFTSDGDEAISLGTIKEDDEETVSFKFQLPAKFDDGDYRLAVKAYSDKSGESKECIDSADDFDAKYYNEISIVKQDDDGKYIAFDNIVLSSDKGTCGDTITLSFDAYNVGDTDLQDKIKINAMSKELGLNAFEEVVQDMDMGDKASFQFVFQVPANAANKKHTISLWADYDYYKGKYEISSDTNKNIYFEVIGCNVAPVQIATIDAVLESDSVVAGKPVVVKATIKNTGNSTADFAISAKNFEAWAAAPTISDGLVTLTAGQSKDVTFTFNIKDDAQGAQSFIINAYSGGKSADREVELTIEKSSSFLGSLGGNSMIWVIGAVNVILIVLIIVVAIKLTRN